MEARGASRGSRTTQYPNAELQHPSGPNPRRSSRRSVRPAAAGSGWSSPLGSTIVPQPGRLAGNSTSRGPLRLWSQVRSPGPSRLQWARASSAARVAWPQRGTSQTGVNQRNIHPCLLSSRKAVSDWRRLAATACIHSSGIGASRATTAAPLPPKGPPLKASINTAGKAPMLTPPASDPSPSGPEPPPGHRHHHRAAEPPVHRLATASPGDWPGPRWPGRCADPPRWPRCN